MCGITGFLSFDSNSAINLANVHQSNNKLKQRGPDSGNIFVHKHVALGHRRLSIIDTSDHAMQPMQDKSGRYVLVFNGEIFNYKELSQKYLDSLWKKIGPPLTHSDTEVLLYLLIEYGAECLNWLQGFFAFCLLDTTNNSLLLARDPFGKKPLNIYSSANEFAFASEMKALLEWPVPRKVNYTILQQYLQLNYIPQPYSMLEGVEKLRPGHYMKVDANGASPQTLFYKTRCAVELYKQYDYATAQRQLESLMEESVVERMIADVPLGAFLSGGIDSSVIVALASRHTQQLNTFSVGYKDNPYFDETHYAQLVAKKYNTNHHVFALSNDDFLQHIHDVLDYIDEPFADSSAIPVYILSHETRKHVTVALSGDGADEVFSGYNKHAAEWKIRQSSIAKSLVKMGAPLWKALPHSRNGKLSNLFRQLDRFAQGAALSTEERYWRWASFNSEKDASSLLSERSRQQTEPMMLHDIKREMLAAIKSDDFNEVLLTDVKLVLSGDMLVKVDLMSMANSLEIRSPFLDKRVVDFAFSLPSSYKIDGTMKKKIVQDAFRKLLPEELYKRPKHGFEIPLLDWFRNELWGMIDGDLLADDFIEEQGIFNPLAIKQLKARLKSNNPEDSHATIWALIVFQYWWRKYIAE